MLTSKGYILGGLILLIPLFTHFSTTSNECLPIFWTTTTCLLLSGMGSYFTIAHHTRVKINKTDIIVFLYLVHGYIRWLLTRDFPRDPVIPCEWLGLTCVYIFARNLNDKAFRSLVLFILFAGSLQAIESILQYAEILPSLHKSFPVTGSFYNPGPLGGYMAIILVCGICTWSRQTCSSRHSKIILPITLLALLATLILSDSRAAWLAVMVSTIILEWQRIKSTFIRHSIFRITATLILIIFITSLYFYKKGSADMRLLTWCAQLLMFRDAPLFGHGVGSFSTKYMLYQAEYLNAHPDGNLALIADNNILAFNEYLHLLVEQGIIGFTLFALIITSVIRQQNNFKQKMAFGGIICTGIFAFFSYPASVLPIKIFIPLFLGILAQNKQTVFELTPNAKLFIPVATTLLAGLYFNLKTHIMYNDAFRYLDKKECFRTPFPPEDNTLYTYMLHDKAYLYRLSEQLIRSNQPEQALTVKQHLARLAPTSSLLCDIGILHLKNGENHIADSLFTKAHQMTPNHITPVYNRFLVTRQTNNTLQGLRLAKKILHMPVRTINNIVLRARHEAKEYIKAQS